LVPNEPFRQPTKQGGPQYSPPVSSNHWSTLLRRKPGKRKTTTQVLKYRNGRSRKRNLLLDEEKEC